MQLPRFSFSLLIGLVSCAATANAALDFTLHRVQTAADGASVDSTYILDGESRIFMRIPRPWKIEDSPAALEFIPDQPDSRIRIENVSGVQALPFDPAGKAALRQRVDHSLPPLAKITETPPDVDNPLPIFGWKDVEMSRVYEVNGQSICHSIMFMNMHPGRVVQVSITAPKAQYDAVHDAVRVLMFSWFEPSKDLPKESARRLGEGSVGS